MKEFITETWTKSKIWVIIFILLNILALFLSYQLLMVFPLWYLLSYFLLLKIPAQGKARRKAALAVFFFPIAELGVKLWIIFNVIPYTWVWVNRIEHMIPAIILTYLFLQIPEFSLKGKLNKKLYNAFIVLSLINLLGVFNEFWEFAVRLIAVNLPIKALWDIPENITRVGGWAYYVDTILDLLTNLTGGLIMVLPKLIVNRSKTK